MVLLAEGVAGSSYDYVRNVRNHLEALGVSAPAVDELWGAVGALKDGSAND
jgi:cation transport regulator ChaC